MASGRRGEVVYVLENDQGAETFEGFIVLPFKFLVIYFAIVIEIVQQVPFFHQKAIDLQ